MTVWRQAPTARIMLHSGTWWHEDPSDPGYTGPMFLPAPTGTAMTIRYHILLGVLHGYSLPVAARYAWAHRHTFT